MLPGSCKSAEKQVFIHQVYTYLNARCLGLYTRARKEVNHERHGIGCV